MSTASTSPLLPQPAVGFQPRLQMPPSPGPLQPFAGGFEVGGGNLFQQQAMQFQQTLQQYQQLQQFQQQLQQQQQQQHQCFCGAAMCFQCRGNSNTSTPTHSPFAASPFLNTASTSFSQGDGSAGGYKRGSSPRSARKGGGGGGGGGDSIEQMILLQERMQSVSASLAQLQGVVTQCQSSLSQLVDEQIIKDELEEEEAAAAEAAAASTPANGGGKAASSSASSSSTTTTPAPPLYIPQLSPPIAGGALRRAFSEGHGAEASRVYEHDGTGHSTSHLAFLSDPSDDVASPSPSASADAFATAHESDATRSETQKAKDELRLKRAMYFASSSSSSISGKKEGADATSTSAAAATDEAK